MHANNIMLKWLLSVSVTQFGGQKEQSLTPGLWSQVVANR